MNFNRGVSEQAKMGNGDGHENMHFSLTYMGKKAVKIQL